MNRVTLLASAGLIAIASWFGGYFFGKSSQEKAVPALDAVAQARLDRSKNLGLQVNPEAKSVPQGLEKIQKIPSKTQRTNALGKYFENLSQAEFEKETAKILNELKGSPNADDYENLTSLLNKWGEIDPIAAIDFLKKREGDWWHSDDIFQGWAEKDPESAAIFYKRELNSFPEKYPQKGSLIAGEWARVDPEAAFRWAQTLEEDERNSAIIGVFSIVNKDIPLAIKMTATLPAENRAAAIGSIAKKWATQDWAAAQAWIATLPKDEQNKAQAKAFEALSSLDPGAARLEIAKLPAGEARDLAIKGTNWRLGAKDPKGAISWVMSVSSDENIQAGVVRSAVGNWLNKDAKEAKAWIENQPMGKVRDAAIQSFICSSASSDYALEASFIESVQDEQKRRSLAEQIARGWLYKDKETAAQWIQNNQILTPAAKAKILEDAAQNAARTEDADYDDEEE